MTPRRTALLRQLDDTLRKVSAQSVLLSDTVGRLVGINSTDLECLDLLYVSGPITAGRLAEHTGLTTGAMTAAIDRLERAGYVRRSRDARDRRRVLVEALPAGMRRIEPLYARLADATMQLHAQYRDKELELVVDYLSRAVDLVAEHVSWLQTQPPVRHRPLRARRATSPARRRASASSSEALQR